MPKYGIHHIVLNDAIEHLLANPNAKAHAAGEELAIEKDTAMIGAVGPDLFFWAPDYEVVDKVYRLHKNIEAIVDLYNQVVQPMRDIRDAVVEPVEDLVESLAPSVVALIRQAIEEMRETARLYQATLSTGLFAGVISGFNFLTDLASLPRLSAEFFELFKPPLQNNRPEKEWYWFDMLHYRNTGQFAKALVKNSKTVQQRAYAHGYLSHVATDLVGHACVNQIVGGPYRLHPQRHVTVENYMDCWKFNEYYGQSINLTLFDKLGIPSELPAQVGDLIHRSFRDAYPAAVPHPTRLPNGGWLERNQIDQTYEIFYDVLQIMKKMAIARPEEPFSGAAEVLENALRDVLQPPPSPPSSPSGTCSWEDTFALGLTSSSRDCYEEFFDQLENWCNYLTELFAWAFETLLDLFDLLQALLLSLPVMVLLAILYGLQLLLYEIYQSLRQVLALEGFLFPEPEYMNDAHGRNLTTNFHCGIQPFKYPQWPQPNISHLSCIASGLESPATAADFNSSSHLITPNVFIKDTPFSLKALAAYAQSMSPENTRRLEEDESSIGNATDLTAWMIAAAHDGVAEDKLRGLVYTNWNLDADRGYGYKTWRGAIPSEGGGVVGHEQYV